MDKYEFNIKVEQIKKLVNKGDFETAMKIADTIDWRRVRNANLLAMISQVYEKNGEYSEAKEVLLLAFERAPIGKRLLYKLTELALKEGSVKEAEDYYREFCDMAPDDSRQHLLRYMILKEKKASDAQLIHSLECYVSTELDEKWMYELASLYARANMVPECIQMCDRIMLMFGIGKYVDMAMELKTQFAPLSDYQVDLVENRDKYEAKLKAVEEEYEGRYDNQFQPDDQFQDQGQDQPEYGQQEQQYVDQDPYADQGSYVGENQYVDQSQYTEADQSQYVDAAQYETQPQYAETQEEPYAAQPPYDEQQPEAIQPEYDDYQEPEVVVTEDTEIAEEDRTEKGDQETEELVEEPVRTQRDLHNIKPVTKMAAEAMEVQNAPGTEDDGVEEEPAMQPMMANHLMIEAKTPEKGLQIAIDALKKIHNELGCNNQVVKISAGKLNQRGLMTIADKLAGKDLIVEEAGDLQENELEALQKLISRDETGMIIVLIDNPYQMEQLHKQNPGLAAQFECIGSEKDDTQTSIERAVQKQIELETQIAREEELSRQAEGSETEGPREEITDKNSEEVQKLASEEEYSENEEIMDQEPEAAGEIEEKMDQEEEDAPESEEEQPEETYAEPEDDTEMDLDAFANYACDYARSIDCSLKDKSMLALYERIEIMEEDGIPLTKANAEALIEEAADKAEKPSLGKRIKGLFSSKYDKDGLLILKEEHFI
ncbi:hypothetical protein ACTM9N_14025 [Lachnospiraceae bacterium HCP1S3_A8]|nr:hypothetical protein [Lachnospiraceae bacterium]